MNLLETTVKHMSVNIAPDPSAHTLELKTPGLTVHNSHGDNTKKRFSWQVGHEEVVNRLSTAGALAYAFPLWLYVLNGVEVVKWFRPGRPEQPLIISHQPWQHQHPHHSSTPTLNSHTNNLNREFQSNINRTRHFRFEDSVNVEFFMGCVTLQTPYV